MIRNSDKQAYPKMTKNDFPSIPSPKKKSPGIPKHLIRPTSEVQMKATIKKNTDTCKHVQFNSPRKRYMAQQPKTPTNNVCQVSIADQLKQDQIWHQSQLAKILLQQRENLQNQRHFLLKEQSKVDRETEWLRQRIQALTQKVKKMQQQSPLPPPPSLPSQEYQREMVAQKGNSFNLDTQSSDFFRSV